jgi:pimeloyl-ACP methyl ester carboxylesterase
MQDGRHTHFTPAGGPKLHVDDCGGEGLPVLLQHGLCGDARQTAEVFPPSEAFRRLTLECRGHGHSGAGNLKDISIARFTDDAIAFIEHHGLAPLVVGGISMGAAISMRIAVTRPDLVRGLIIARPAWSISRAPPNMQSNADVGELLARMTQDEARASFVASATAQRLAAEAPDNLASLMGFFDRDPQEVTAALLQSISADGPGVTAQQLQAIAVPTLVIANGMDSVHPMALAKEIAALIPKARFAEITAKAADRARYVSDFQNTLNMFLKGFLQ